MTRIKMARKSGRPPKNEIGHDSQQKIIDAAVKLITERGADNITVRKDCTEAESSIGTYYHYFRDKDELLMYFIQELPFKNCELKIGKVFGEKRRAGGSQAHTVQWGAHESSHRP